MSTPHRVPRVEQHTRPILRHHLDTLRLHDPDAVIRRNPSDDEEETYVDRINTLVSSKFYTRAHTRRAVWYLLHTALFVTYFLHDGINNNNGFMGHLAFHVITGSIVLASVPCVLLRYVSWWQYSVGLSICTAAWLGVLASFYDTPGVAGLLAGIVITGGLTASRLSWRHCTVLPATYVLTWIASCAVNKPANLKFAPLPFLGVLLTMMYKILVVDPTQKGTVAMTLLTKSEETTKQRHFVAIVKLYRALFPPPLPTLVGSFNVYPEDYHNISSPHVVAIYGEIMPRPNAANIPCEYIIGSCIVELVARRLGMTVADTMDNSPQSFVLLKGLPTGHAGTTNLSVPEVVQLLMEHMALFASGMGLRYSHGAGTATGSFVGRHGMRYVVSGPVIDSLRSRDLLLGSTPTSHSPPRHASELLDAALKEIDFVSSDDPAVLALTKRMAENKCDPVDARPILATDPTLTTTALRLSLWVDVANTDEFGPFTFTNQVLETFYRTTFNAVHKTGTEMLTTSTTTSSSSDVNTTIKSDITYLVLFVTSRVLRISMCVVLGTLLQTSFSKLPLWFWMLILCDTVETLICFTTIVLNRKQGTKSSTRRSNFVVHIVATVLIDIGWVVCMYYDRNTEEIKTWVPLGVLTAMVPYSVAPLHTIPLPSSSHLMLPTHLFGLFVLYCTPLFVLISMSFPMYV
eukprot:PhF_6_TR44211/c2_g2_i3/m.67901